MSTAGIYVRISQDREGAGLGVARQEEDCRALAERRGWGVAEVYVDNDVSAYSGARRPAWERLLDDVRSGAIDAVVGWHVDRLTRSPAELELVIDLADRHGLALGTVTGDVDLATPTGRMVARILGATARQEGEHKAERQRRQRRQAAEAGKVSGGGARPFGFDQDRVTVLQDEAEVIRECARRVLAQESLSSVCRDLAARGVATPKGGSWQPMTMRRMLASARISGRREHTPRRSGAKGTRPLLGEVVADAVWPAIISAEDSDRLRALLADPSRRRVSPTGTSRTYLLSGILRCGRCGHGLVGRPRSGVARYACASTPGGTSCGGIATNAERTDDLVRDLVLVALSSPDLLDRLRSQDDPEPGLAASVAADEEQLAELAQMWGAGEVTRGEWQAARTVIESRLERGRARLAKASSAAPLAGMTGDYDALLGRWEALNRSQRRAVVGAVVERIDVAAADPRKRWDPSRFNPSWRA